MKCKFCGAKVGKTEEICPECGKYLLSQESSADMGECLQKFNCNDRIPIFGFIIVVAIAAFVIVASEYGETHMLSPRNVMLLISGVFLCAVSVYLCIICLKSYICVCEKGIHGVITQKKKAMPKHFELYYDEIEYVDLSVVRGGKGTKSYTVTILTKTQEEFSIGVLNQKNSELLVDILRRMIK